MLSSQTTSLNTLFGGESPDTITANGQSVITSMGSALDSQFSQFATARSSMQSIMSSVSVFLKKGK